MAQQVAPRQSIRVEISNRNRLFHLLNFVNRGGVKSEPDIAKLPWKHVVP